MRDRINPFRLRIEGSSMCQLKCPSCPNASDAIYPAIGRGYLKVSDFRTLLEQNPGIRDVELSNYGEIFLNPDLMEILKVAHDHRVGMRADTGANLNTATPEQLEGIVRYRLRSLSVSLDGASPETYGRYRVNGDYERVIGHIRMISEFKKSYRSRYPFLTWQFIVFGHNETEIHRARRMARDLGMKFKLKLSWDEDFSPIHDPERVRQEVGYASRSEYRQLHGIDLGHDICHMLWDQPQINWDGRVLGCCRNFWGEFGGDAFADGLQRVLNSQRMLAARRMLTGMGEVRADVPCASCEIYHDRVRTGRFVNRSPMIRLVRTVYHRLRLVPFFRGIFFRGY